MTEQVQQLVQMSLKQPVRLAADAAGKAPAELRQEIVRLKVSRLPVICKMVLHSVAFSPFYCMTAALFSVPLVFWGGEAWISICSFSASMFAVSGEKPQNELSSPH